MATYQLRKVPFLQIIQNKKNILPIVFLFVLFSSCNSSPENSKTETETSKTNSLDDRISNSSDIADFLPAVIKKHEDVTDFLCSYVKVGDNFYSHFYQNLNNQAELEGAFTDMNEGDDGKDVVKSFKKTYKSLKQVRKSTVAVLKTAWSGKDLLTLEDKRNELKNKYSIKVIDSFKYVEKAIDKYLYYSYANPAKGELEKIKNHNSFRTMPSTFTKDQKKELDINSTLKKFISLQKSANEIRKILVFNKLIGRK